MQILPSDEKALDKAKALLRTQGKVQLTKQHTIQANQMISQLEGQIVSQFENLVTNNDLDDEKRSKLTGIILKNLERRDLMRKATGLPDLQRSDDPFYKSVLAIFGGLKKKRDDLESKMEKNPNADKITNQQWLKDLEAITMQIKRLTDFQKAYFK